VSAFTFGIGGRRETIAKVVAKIAIVRNAERKEAGFILERGI
jgi:hypothetical protein